MRALVSARFGAIVGAFFGLAVAIPIMYIAWDHNPQGEFHDEFGVNWEPWLLIGATWFAPVATAIALISGTAHWLATRNRTDPPMTRNQWLGGLLGLLLFFGSLAAGWAIHPWVAPLVLLAGLVICMRAMPPSARTRGSGPNP